MTESDQVGDIFPLNCKLLTKEEITCVADKMRAIPDDENDLILPDVIERILGTEFCANFIDFYTDINEVQFRRDMTFLIRRIGFYGTQQDRKCLVDNGIPQFILENCRESDDSLTVFHIVTVLRNISCKDNFVSLPSLVKDRLYSKVEELLVKWRSNDDIVGRLLRMIVTIVSHETPADSKDCGESHAETLVNTLRSSSDIVRDIIKSSTSRSSEVIVLAAILLHKYIEPVKSSELLDILVPINNFTSQEITKLADNIKEIPASEADVKKKVISKLVKINFIDKFCGLYQENTEEKYRRDLTYIIRRVAALGNSNMKRLLVRKGVTKLLITECELCTDKEIVLNITRTLISVAYRNNTNKLYLANNDDILLIPALIEKWSGEDNEVVRNVLGMLKSMTVSDDFVEQIASVISEQGINIPVLLTDLLNSSTDKEVLECTVECIRNMLIDSMILHEHFSTQHFIDTCFNESVKSDLLSEEYRYRILRFNVLKLTCNNPQLVTKLLVKHVYYLRELSVLGQNLKLSRIAADIINKYLSCVEKKHKCRVISSFVLLNILRFVLLYIVDIVLDIKIGLDSIFNDSEHIRYEGYGILVFSIIPLFYINYQSLLRYYKTCFKTSTVDSVISLQGSSRGKYLKFLVPWKCDSVNNFLMNVITVFQLHPVITAVELARHSSQRLEELINKKLHFARLTVQEKILENVPCTLIKIIILYKTFVPEEGLSQNYLTYLSTVYGIVTLTYKLSSFEKLCRAADGTCSTLTKIQTGLVFIANFTAVSSRIMMCLILYTLSAYINKTWIFASGIGLHMIITLIIHSLAHHRRFDPYKVESTQRKFVTWDYLVREGSVKNSISITLGRSALILCLSWSEGFIVNLRHPIDLLSGSSPHTDHLRSPLYFFSIYTLHLLEVISVAVLASVGVLEANDDWIKHLGYVSVALYLISGALFTFYFTVLNPDKKEKPLSTNVNTRFKHMGYTIQVSILEQYCHVTPKKTMKIKGKKIHSSPDFNYRLQVMKPCLYCVLGVKHEKSESGELNKCSLNGFMRRIKDCFTNHGKRQLDFNDEDGYITDQLRYQNRSEIDWLMKKVTNYHKVHSHLLFFFPGINYFKKDNTDLVNTCKELGVFRSIIDITDDELSPGVVAYCSKVEKKINTLYDTVKETDEISDTQFEEFDRLCEDYFSLQEAAWEEKCLIWCTTAPTKILTKYNVSKWYSPECKKEIRKWIESQKKKNTVNEHATFHFHGKQVTSSGETGALGRDLDNNEGDPDSNNNTGDSITPMFGDEHSTFYIHGETTGQQLWVTRRWRELSNCCHGDMGYQPVEVELGNV